MIYKDNLGGWSSYLKRIVRLPELISRIEGDRILFPGGVVCGIESYSRDEVAKRVEVLSEEAQRYGILRELSVAYASHPTILDVASRSGYVVEVRSLSWSKRHPIEKYRSDLLVVKCVEQERCLSGTMLVSSRWMKKLGLDTGDKVILSNPIRDYTLSPPEKKLYN